MAKTNPKPSKKEYARLEARIAPELKMLFTKAAEIQGTNLTNFIVASAKKEAETIIKENSLLSLTLRDMILLTQLAKEDSEPNAKLRAAANKFKSSLNS